MSFPRVDVAWPVYDLHYRCLKCGRALAEKARAVPGTAEDGARIPSKCCTGATALLVGSQRVENPPWEVVAEVYGP